MNELEQRVVETSLRYRAALTALVNNTDHSAAGWAQVIEEKSAAEHAWDEATNALIAERQR